MSKSLTIYSRLSLRELEGIVQNFKEEFDHLLNDTFSEAELVSFEKKIDDIAAIFTQPILSDLTFDDFYPDPKKEESQRIFFNECRSSILLENLPFLESNPFQVTYLRKLLNLFSEALIDKGGVSELQFKGDFLLEIAPLKDIDTIVPPEEKKIERKTHLPVDPIDFLILDVYKEIDRLKGTDVDISELSHKVQKVYLVMKEQRLDSTQLIKAIGLNPKDFDDGLERLKFWLRKY